MINPSMSFVLFADVLGFKRLVLDNRVPRFESLDFRDLDFGLTGMRPRNPIARGFTGFHGAVERAVQRMAWQQAELLVFSDSIFLSTSDARECMEFASDLMRHTIAADVPLRMGIGYGTFVSYGLSVQRTPFLTFSSSQFFGSGVVYATETEKALRGCGMRIGVHQSAATELSKDAECSDRLLQLPVAVPKVPFEWNYLGDIRAEGVDEGARRDNLREHVSTMLNSAPDDEHVQGQYLKTLDAIAKMPVRAPK